MNLGVGLSQFITEFKKMKIKKANKEIETRELDNNFLKNTTVKEEMYLSIMSNIRKCSL